MNSGLRVLEVDSGHWRWTQDTGGELRTGGLRVLEVDSRSLEVNSGLRRWTQDTGGGLWLQVC